MKRKFTFLIAAAVMLLTMMATTGTMWGQTRGTVTDQMTANDLASTGSYTSFSNVSLASEAVYAGNTSREYYNQNYNIQMRGSSNGGIVTTTSGGTITNVTITTNHTNNYYIEIYGKHTAYESSSDLYDANKRGTLIGSCQMKTTQSTINVTDSYEFVGMKVKTSNTVYISSIDFVWDDGGGSTSTDPEITFAPASITLGEVLVGNQASTTFSVSQANLSSDITLTVDNGNLSPSSIEQGAAATSVTWTYTPTAAGDFSATVTATSGNTSETLEISGTAVAPVEGYDVDFEYATNMYPNWTFNNMESHQTGSITAHGGTYYGTTGGKSTASITTTSTVANPGTLTCYVSKQSSNTTSSTWYIQVSSNGSSWTNVESQSATSMSQGSWVEFSADLSSYTDVYVRVYYNGSTAIRNIDDLTLTTAAPSNIFTVTYDGNGNTSGSIPTDDNEYESGDEVTVLGNTGSLAKAGYTFGGWNTQADGLGTNYTAGNTFEITSNTTLYAKWNAKAITSLSYTGTPTKTEYASGESFDPTGLIVTATFDDSSSEEVTALVVWTPDPLTTGITSVTGTYMGQTINISGLTVTAAPGSADNPYTVAQARDAIDAGTGITDVYVTGIISQVDSYNSSYHSITYWISGDGTTTSDQLEVYSGKGLNNTNFSSIDDVAVGATVVVYGTLKKYDEVYEFNYNNYLTSYTAPVVAVEAPTFSPDAGTYDEAQSVTLSCTTEGSTIYYTTDGTNPTNESTEYTDAINVENTTTIKAIAYVGNDYSTVATATYTIVALNNISDITEVGTAYSVKGTVVATNNKGLIIGDGTGYVYYYKNGSVDQSIGDMIKISGNTVTYGQIIQFTSATPNTATITEATTSSYDGTPAAAVITEVPDYSEGYHLSTYLEFTGDLAKSGSNYLITVGEGENNQIQISYPTTDQGNALTALVGKTVHVKGYFSGINSSSKFTVMLESAEEVLVPSITLNPSVINEAPADGGSGEITVTCTNMGDNPVLSIEFCDANGEPAEYGWITAVFNDTYTNITGTFTENTSTEPRTAHLKVYGTVPNSTTIVYSEIFSITQLAPAGPSIVFETASVDLEAGGESDRKLSFDYSGLGSTPTFTINYYEQDGETAVTEATYDWLTASIDENNKLNITVGDNTGEARSAYLKVYGVKNENVHAESNLVTVNQAAYVAPSQEVTDVLNLEFTGVSGTSYSDWSDKTGTSGAVYAGNSAGGNDAIQLRSKNSSGIVTTTSGGKVTKVEVTWNANTDEGRTLNIYGSDTAYESASDLYDDNAGTLIGTIVKGTSTELTVSDEYDYIGLRSANNAMYLDEINITWSTGPAVPSIAVAPAEINIDANENNEELGVTVANISSINVDNFNVDYCNSDGTEIEGDKPDIIDDYVFTANQQDEGYTLTITFKANTGDARTAYFNVIYASGENDNVHSNVITVNQEAYVAPVATITVVPNEVLDVPAEGDVYVHTVTLENMTVESTDDFTLAFCDENGEVLDEQAPKPDWIEIGDVEFAVTSEENVYSLTYPVAENTETTPRTAYFKVAATQTSEAVYSNLVTVTQDGYVPPVVTDDYELFSGTLVEGDYIIVYDGSAMNDEVSNDRLQFKSVTSVNNVISTDDATIVWHIAQSGDYWTIYSADANAYAASTGAKNKAQMLADGTDDKALWSVESTSQSETYDFVNKQNTTNNVNAILRNNKDTNNNYGFACYASGTGGALSLYKKVDNTPAITLNSYEIEATAAGAISTLTATYKNINEVIADVEYYESDGTTVTTYDWFEAGVNSTDNTVIDYVIEENDGNARTAYFKVYALVGDEYVYSNLVTVSQAAPVAPTASIVLTDSGSSSTPVDPYHIEFPCSVYGGYIDYVEYNNFQSTLVADDFNIEYFDSDNEPLSGKPEWIQLLQVYYSQEEEQLRLLIAVYANTTAEQRTAYFKVWAMNGEEKVYSDIVTLTQAPADYATLPFEFDGGKADIENTVGLTQGGLGSDYSSSPKLKFDGTGDWVILKINETPGILSFDIKGNGFSGSTFTVQTSEDGTTYTDLTTYTELSSTTQNESFDNLGENVRYIKWIYTEKVQNGGNVALGNIALAAYDNTPSLSFNGSSANIGTYAVGEEITLDNIIVSQHNLTANISLNADKGTVTPNSIVAGAEPTEVVWRYTPTEAGYTTATITATSGTIEDSFEIQFVAKTPHDINTVAEHGTIVVLDNKTTAIENENVDFTVTPDEGYELNEITVMAGETPVEYMIDETFYRFQMPDSDVTISATFNELPKYTVTFTVNNHPDGELIITQGNSTPLPTTSEWTPTGFAISGWAEEGSTIAVIDPYTPTADVYLYALLQLENAPTASGDYVKVTEALTDWSGEYLIVYEDGNVAFDGSLTTLDANGNTYAVTITNNTIEATTTTNASKFTITALSEGGYSIQSASGYFIGQTTDDNGLASSTTNAYTNSISFDTENNYVNVISSGGAYLRYNSDANRFRYYKSSSYTNQKAIQLYKKETTSFNYVEILNNIEPEQTWTEPIPESTCLVVPENVTLTYSGPNPSVPEALVIQDGGQLIHENAVNATIQKGIDGYSSKSGSGWYFIASPADGVSTSGLITTPATSYDLYKYNEPNAYWYSNHGANAPFTTLERGIGYLYANTNNMALDFAGEMVGTQTEVTKTLSFECDAYPDLKGYNLMGNPFTRNIGQGDITLGGEPVTSVLLLNNDSEYQTCNFLESGVIKPGQGFFIQATDGEKLELKFNPSSSKDVNEIGLISIKAGDESYIDKAYIQFDGGNTLRKMTLTGDKSQVYVMHHYEDYAAARLYSTTGSVPVNFEAAYEGIFTITIETKNLDLETLRLIDNMTGDEIDLLAESSYTFKANSDEPAERFTLLFEKSILGIDENAENEVFAYQTDDEILVSGEGTLQVFDVMGRFVASYEVNGSKRISTSLFNTGVYIFKMTGENNMTQKIVVR